MRKGLGVRHVHATGNEADVTVADLAEAVVEDSGVRLLLLYMEAIKDPQRLAAAAERARSRGVPIVALKAGAHGARAEGGASRTPARSQPRIGWSTRSSSGTRSGAPPTRTSWCRLPALYASGRPPRGRRLVVVSNSGASCVMAADYSEQRGIPLAQISRNAKEKLGKAFPGFAALENPIDVTGALLSNSGLFGAVLPIVGDDAQSELAMLAIPVAGTGYDVPRFAKDLSLFADCYGHAVAVAAPQESVRAPFERLGIAAFEREREAIDAPRDSSPTTPRSCGGPRRRRRGAVRLGPTRFLNEAESLALLAQAGLR